MSLRDACLYSTQFLFWRLGHSHKQVAGRLPHNCVNCSSSLIQWPCDHYKSNKALSSMSKIKRVWRPFSKNTNYKVWFSVACVRQIHFTTRSLAKNSLMFLLSKKCNWTVSARYGKNRQTFSITFHATFHIRVYIKLEALIKHWNHPILYNVDYKLYERTNGFKLNLFPKWP